MPAQTTTAIDKANDCLKTEVIYKGKPGEGAAQVRAVVPLEPVRVAVHGAVASRLERSTGRRVKRDALGGCVGMPPALAERVEGLVQKVAAQRSTALVAKAAAAPTASLRQKMGRALARKKRVAMFVALAVGGSLAAMGGWLALRALLRKKRAARTAQLISQGKTADEAKRLTDLQGAEEEEDLTKAIAVVDQQGGAEGDDEDDEDEDDDDEEDDDEAPSGRTLVAGADATETAKRELRICIAKAKAGDPVAKQRLAAASDVSGFSLKRFARGVFMPHTLLTDRFKKRGGPSAEQRAASAAARREAAQARITAAQDEQAAQAAEAEAAEAEAAAKAGPPAGDEQQQPNEEGQPMSNVQGWSNPFKKLLERHAAKVVPGGGATVAVAKMTQKKNPKLSKSAFRLFKARKGDPKAKKEILAVRKLAAKPGNPNAKAELKRLHQANNMALKLEKPKSLFSHGIV
jgi:hypothetical protein